MHPKKLFCELLTVQFQINQMRRIRILNLTLQHYRIQHYNLHVYVNKCFYIKNRLQISKNVNSTFQNLKSRYILNLFVFVFDFNRQALQKLS